MAALTYRAGTLNGTASATSVTAPYPVTPLTTEIAYVSVWTDNTTLPTCTSSDATWALISHATVAGGGLAVFWARVPSTAPATVTVANASRTGTEVLLVRMALVANQNATGTPYYALASDGGLVSSSIPSTNVSTLQTDDSAVFVFQGVGDNGALTVTAANSFSNAHSGNTAIGDGASMRFDRRNLAVPTTAATPVHSYAVPDAPWVRISLVATSVEYAPAGPQAIDGTLASNAQMVYGATIAASYDISGGNFDSAQTFYQSAVERGVAGISGALFTNTQTFHGATVASDGASQTITGTLFTNDNVFFAAIVDPGSVSRFTTSSGTSWSPKTLSRLARDAERARKKGKARTIILRDVASSLGGSPYAQDAAVEAVASVSMGTPISQDIIARTYSRAQIIMARMEDEDAEFLLLAVA